MLSSVEYTRAKKAIRSNGRFMCPFIYASAHDRVFDLHLVNITNSPSASSFRLIFIYHATIVCLISDETRETGVSFGLKIEKENISTNRCFVVAVT